MYDSTGYTIIVLCVSFFSFFFPLLRFKNLTDTRCPQFYPGKLVVFNSFLEGTEIKRSSRNSCLVQAAERTQKTNISVTRARGWRTPPPPSSLPRIGSQNSRTDTNWTWQNFFLQISKTLWTQYQINLILTKGEKKNRTSSSALTSTPLRRSKIVSSDIQNFFLTYILIKIGKKPF